MTTTEFEVDVTTDDARRFAELSGDWNPLHTDTAYAERTSYGRPILHGAFSAGLVSRMAGMHIPGRDCLLHGINLKFVSPIFPPARLRVRGVLASEKAGEGMVEINISDVGTGVSYVRGSYVFGRHSHSGESAVGHRPQDADTDSVTLVTGASGGLGAAVLARLGARGLGVSRSGAPGAIEAEDLARLPELLEGRKINGIVHCGWPTPDNQHLTSLGSGTDAAIRHHLAEPLADCIKLAQVLASHGAPGALLVLVGSTFAQAGRHSWRMPLYSLSKSLVPTLVQVLALELGVRGFRCAGLVFDVIEGKGMNAAMRDAIKLSHADRSPFGTLASADAAAGQVVWILDNPSILVSGALLTLSGGALP
jgi:3-hydroxybutyryl-CoA dehydratase